MHESGDHFPTLLSCEEAAEELRISSQRIRQLIAEGSLKAQRVGRTWVIQRRHLDDIRAKTTAAALLAAEPHVDRIGLKALSFFSGAMGLDLGLEQAGINTHLACESDRWARETITSNRQDIPVLGDIWKYSPEEILAFAGFPEGQDIDVIAGGPPCQAFSTAGSRRGFEDVRGNVFLHFIDLIRHLRPRYAVIENVRGLLSMGVSESQAQAIFSQTHVDSAQKHGAIRLVTHLLREAGYFVSFNLYNAANFGTPQIRERVVMIASRDGGPVQYLSPTHSDDPTTGLLPWRTLRHTFEKMPDHSPTFLPFPESRLQYYRMLGPGQYWKHLPKDIQPQAMGKSYHLGGGKTGFYRRIAWDRPSPTLVTHPAMPATDLGHPTEDRPLSIEEYKEIQQFPADWKIAGRLQQQYKQVGNAVPLGLGEAIGRVIVAHDRGESLPIPEGFRFSRYRNTSDRDLAPL